MGGLQVEAVDTPFRAVTPGQVRNTLQLSVLISTLYSMQCFMIMKNVWELLSLLTLVLHYLIFNEVYHIPVSVI